MKLSIRKPVLGEWKPWFAWHPVVVETSTNTYYVWLEHVERFGKCVNGPGYSFIVWEYAKRG